MRYRMILVVVLFGLFVIGFSEEATSTVSTDTATTTIAATQTEKLGLDELLEKKKEVQLELLRLNEMIDEYIRSALGTTVEIQDVLTDIRGDLEEVWKMYEDLKLETATSIKELENSLESLRGRIEELDGKLADLWKQLDEELSNLNGKFDEINTRLNALEKKTQRPQLWDFLILGVAAIAVVLPFVIK